MSELSDKLSSPQGTGGRARASYAQLSQRWGFAGRDGDEVRVCEAGNDKPERWLHVAGRADSDSALYELLPEAT